MVWGDQKYEVRALRNSGVRTGGESVDPGRKGGKGEGGGNGLRGEVSSFRLSGMGWGASLFGGVTQKVRGDGNP